MHEQVHRTPEIPSGLGGDPASSFDPMKSRLVRPRASSTHDTLRLPSGDHPEETLDPSNELLVVPPVAPHVGAPANAFLLRAVIGRGGMGDVWEGEQRSLARTVAVKRIRRDIAGGSPNDPEWREVVSVFRQEAFTTAHLEHPNIVPVYDYGTDEAGSPQLAMKLVRGDPWIELLERDEAMPVADFLSRHLPILISMAQAVAYAHSRGIVHRDLKPSQVMVGEFGEVLLMDWGLAVSVADPTAAAEGGGRMLAGAPTRDAASSPSGTPSYMAPEQTESSAARVGTWTDVYLLGATLYYVLTLTPVHLAETAQAAFLRAATGIVERPQDRSPGREVPRELADLAMKSLSPDPRDRPGSVREFIAALHDYLSGAGRRREAADLLGQARARMERSDSGYPKFAEALALLDKARAAWPSTPGIEDVRGEVVARYARAAVSHGDLVLATLQMESLEPGETREGISAAIREEERRRARLVGQRRWALLAVGVLALALLAGGANLLEARRREEGAREREAQQRATAALLDRLNALRSGEEALALDMARDIPLPETGRRSVQGLEVARRVVDRARAAELLARRAALQRERASLLSQSILEGKIGPEPPALFLAEANLRAADANTSATIAAAYHHYLEATRTNPGSPEAWRGLGIMAARAGYLTSASLALERATSETIRLHGRNHAEYAAAISRQADVLVDIDPLDPDLKNFYQLSRGILEPQLVDLLSSVGVAGFGFGEADEAVELTSQAARLVIRRHGVDSSQALVALAPYAEALRNSGRFREALAVRLSSLRSQERVYPDDLKMRAALLSHLAESERDVGDYARAMADTDEAIDLLRNRLHAGEIALMGLEVQRLNLITDTGNLEEAERAARSLIGRLRSAVGESHPTTTRSMMTLCEILLQSNRAAEAENLLRRIIEIRAFDGQYADVGTLEPLIFLASALSYQNKDEEAAATYRRALGVARRLRGPEHPHTLAIMNNLAAHYGSRERWRESLELLAEVVPIMVGVYGASHPNMAVLYMNLMPCLVDIGDFEQAELCGRMSLSLIRSKLGERHQFHERALGRIAQNHGRMLIVGGHPPVESQFAVAMHALRDDRWGGTIRPRSLREDMLWPTLSAADASLRMDPPRPEMARAFLRRAAAITRAGGYEADAPTTVHVLRPLAGRVGVDVDSPEFNPPEGLGAPNGAIRLDVLLPWLDGFGGIPGQEELEGLPTSLDALELDVAGHWPRLERRLSELKGQLPPSLPPGGLPVAGTKSP